MTPRSKTSIETSGRKSENKSKEQVRERTRKQVVLSNNVRSFPLMCPYWCMMETDRLLEELGRFLLFNGIHTRKNYILRN